jgi:hypothetical protein
MNTPRWLSLPSGTPPLGSHTLLRTVVDAREGADPATIEITASSLYRLYVNGTLVLTGPARGTTRYLFVDRVDVGAHLHAGENTIAVEVIYFPDLIPDVLQHEYPDVPPGVAISGRFGGVMVSLGDQWRIYELSCYDPAAFWARGQKAEYVDVSAYPDGWMHPGFDDSSWAAVSGVADPPVEHRERPTPLPTQETVHPKRMTDAGAFLFPERYLTEPIPARMIDWFGGRATISQAIKTDEVRQPATLDHVQYRRVCDAISGGAWVANPGAAMRAEGAAELRGSDRVSGYVNYDLDRCIPGFAAVDVTIPEGARLDVSLLEWIDPEDGSPVDSRNRGAIMVGYGGFSLFGDGSRIRYLNHIQSNFRYICLTARDLAQGDTVLIHEVSAVEHSAFRRSDTHADVMCSDPLLNRIIGAAKETVRVTAHDFAASGGSTERVITAGDCLQASEAGRLFFGRVGRAVSEATFDLFVDQGVGYGDEWPNMPWGRTGGRTRNDVNNMVWMLAPCMLVLDMLAWAREAHSLLPQRYAAIASGMAEDIRSHLTPEGLIEANQQQSNWSDWSRMAVGSRQHEYNGVSVSVNAYYYRMFAELADALPEATEFAELRDSIRSGLRELASRITGGIAYRLHRFVPDLFVRTDDGLKPFSVPMANVFGGSTEIVSETTQYWLLWSGALTGEQEAGLWEILRDWRSFEIPGRDNTRMLSPGRSSSVMGLAPRFKYAVEHRDPVVYRDAKDAFGPNVLADDTLWESLEEDSRSTVHPTTPFVGIALYQALTGILPGLGPTQVRVEPIVDESVRWARGYREVPEGVIGVSWTHTPHRFVLRVGLPSGYGARVRLPDPAMALLRESADGGRGSGDIDLSESAVITVSRADGLVVTAH